MSPVHEDPAQGLLAEVRWALRAANLGQVLECALAGTGAFLLAAAACRLELMGWSAAASGASVLAGTAAAGAWWFANRVGVASVVRRLDGRRGGNGALFTLWERAAAGAASTPLVSLLALRLSSDARVRSLWRGALRVRPWILAATCACAALYAWSLEQAAPSSHGTEELRRALAGLERASAGLTPPAQARARSGATQERRPVDERLAALGAQARTLDARPPAAGHTIAPDVDALEREARALASEGSLSGVQRAALAEFRVALEELRARLSASALQPEPDPRVRGAAGGDSSTAGDLRPGAAGSALQLARSAPPLASPPSDTRPPPAPGGGAGAPRAGAVGSSSAGPWWDPRYDAVVSNWIEARRSER